MFNREEALSGATEGSVIDCPGLAMFIIASLMIWNMGLSTQVTNPQQEKCRVDIGKTFSL